MMQELMKKMAQKKSETQDKQESNETDEQLREKEERKQRQLEAKRLVESKLLNQSQVNNQNEDEQPQSNIVCSSSAPPPPPLIISIVTNTSAPPPPPLMINPSSNNNSSKIQQNGKQNPPQIPIVPPNMPVQKSLIKQKEQKEIISDETKQNLANQRKEAQKLIEQSLQGNKAVESSNTSNSSQQNTNQDVKIVISQTAPPPPPFLNFNATGNNTSILPPPPPPFNPTSLNTKTNNANQSQAEQQQKMQENLKNSQNLQSKNEDFIHSELKKEMQNNIKEAQKSLEEQISSKGKSQQNTVQDVKIVTNTTAPPPPPIGTLFPPPIVQTNKNKTNNQSTKQDEYETPTPYNDQESQIAKQLIQQNTQDSSLKQSNSQNCEEKEVKEIKTNISNRNTNVQIESKFIADKLIGRNSSQNDSPVRKSRAQTHKPIPQLFNFQVNKNTINEWFKEAHEIKTLAPWSSFKKVQFNTIQKQIRQQKYPEQSVLYFKKCAILVDQLEGYIQNTYNDENLKKYRKSTQSIIEQREQQIQTQENIQKEQQIVKLNTKLYDKTIKSMNALMSQKIEQNQFEDCIALRDSIKRLQQLKSQIESEANEEEKTKKINFLNKELADLLQSGQQSTEGKQQKK
ncbi:hypothetical protein TTHERM_00043820 (macronuclear) [Tetrahymena thermophila SB210]|uniref:UVR domain-containing protein n=1 Tax=Tetrahymena thermophila (strain SB210) TaxID=312017 RepID=Q23DW1_TETTS|nr:hypothetical protein TTHERM_00043820 [Tetrahymena thermophila SB210]EAR94587.1 hypothetical protein TTHERM_00043820 [Tetrahymena thermophila SB210]|eukprot:XP_001014575.1 hypothetical protein TTHERM_00043820 [Tetrahymena thermophila SB210]